MTDVGVTPFVDVPSAVTYGQVKGRFVQYVADSSDVGVVPDEIPLEGKVVLTPLTSIVQFPTTVPPRMAVASTVQALVTAGDLKASNGGLLYIIATDQPAGIPDKVQWRATFQLFGIANQPAPVVFEVPANGVVDISMAVSVPLAAPVVTVVNHADAQAAALSASLAATSKTSAQAAQTAAATSATNAAASAASAAAVAGKIYTGTGIPEGQVFAPVGSLYEDTAATRGATLWTKASGTGTIGWQVVYGDTGWRDVTALFAPYVASGKVWLRRQNNDVTLRHDTVVSATDSAAAITANAAIPAGFRTGFYQCWEVMKQANAAVIHFGYIFNSAWSITGNRTATYTAGWKIADPINGQHSYQTVEAWPSVLPGV